ncbi:MAG: DUF3105 domain-containing protein [Thermoleophilaceae bacterium]
MASRKEQKEQLRREREEREAAAQGARRRKRLIGYGAGAAAVLVVVVVAAVVLLSNVVGNAGKSDGSGKALPGGGSIPEVKTKDLQTAVNAAGCKLTQYKGKSREHTADLSKKIKYDSSPPTEGAHYQVPAEDGAYDEAPDVKELVHALEHGRIVIWLKKGLPGDDRAGLKALFDEDSYQMLLTPDPTGMKSQVAASAWTRDPLPNGTGHLLACPKFDAGVYDAIRAFKDEYRGNGPEAVP